MRSPLEPAQRQADAGNVIAAVELATATAFSKGAGLPLLLAADRFLTRLDTDTWARRQVRLALLSSHTSAQLAMALRVAAARHGLSVNIFESEYRRYEQDILDPESALYAFSPEVVVVACDQREVHFPELSDSPDAELDAETARWTGLWDTVRARTGALILQTTFVAPPADALGSIGIQLPGARRRQLARLNLALADAAPSGVHLVDAESAAMRAGTDAWFDDRYWHLSKHAVGLGAVGHLAAATTDVLAAGLGMSRKVVVLDLDNTLWGGVVGEDGVAGLTLGGTPAGEAFVAFQDYVSKLRKRGLVLAVCSKNNPADAQAPFTEHPEMHLSLDDFVAFEASWDPKPVVLRRIAQALDVGLDALVFVDDNPVEREAVRHELPMVGVVDLPTDPTGYVRALAETPGLQTVALTSEDSRRTEQYRARSQATQLAAGAGTREDFLTGLEMSAQIEPLSNINLTRIVQLIGKTNQLNMTTRRHSATDIQRFASREGSVVWGMRVRDRFDDHGLVAVLIAVPERGAFRIDTFLMSCRVLGRGVEAALLDALAHWARGTGVSRLTGTFVPSGRNTPAKDVYRDAGFRCTDTADDGTTTWELDVQQQRVTGASFVATTLPPTHQNVA